MGKKRRMALIAGLVISMAAGSVTAATLAGCKPSPQAVIENVTGVYYGEAGGNVCEIRLDGSSSGTFTFTYNGAQSQGEFTYDGTNLNLTFSDNSIAPASLTKSGENGSFVLNINYNGTSFALGAVNKYAVTFKDGDSVICTVDAVEGKTVKKPAAPEKSGYAFVGWYEDANFNKAFDFTDRTITGATTVYAQYVQIDASKSVFEVKFYDGETEAAEAVNTVNGVVYDLPVLTKSGSTFAGWWVSDYNDASKLTYKYEGQEIKENVTLFAVWDIGAPLVSVSESGIKWTAKGVNNSYEVTVTKPDGTVDDLGSRSTNTEKYDFSDSGEYVITITLRGQTTTVYYNHKSLARVSLFEIDGNVLKFTGVEGAERYALKIDCGNSSHNHEHEINLGDKTEYDFSSCGMKPEGITFIVIAYADGSSSSSSVPYNLERHLDAVKNMSVDDTTDTVKWDAVDGAVSYVVKVKSGDNTQEYRVSSTEVATGFFIGEYSGELEISVCPVASGYNSPAETELKFTKTRLSIPMNIKNDDYRVTWDAVDGATGYIVKIGESEIDVKGTEYTITDEQFKDGVATICVCAKGATEQNNSVFGSPLVINKSFMTPVYNKGEVSWGATLGAKYYEVKVNDGEPVRVNGLSCVVTLTQKGENVIYVRFNDGENTSDWFDVSVTAYEIALEISANYTETVYKAAGDKFDLEDAERQGYTFNGWYVKGGAKFEDSVFGAEDLTLTANFVANKYKVTLIYDSNSGDKADKPETIELTYGEPFTLPVPQSSDPIKVFGGWNSGNAGSGLKFTQPDGVCTQVWSITRETELYVSWYDVFTFTLSQDKKSYSVSGGAGINYVESIIIPDAVDGIPVKSLDSGAFIGCSNLKKVEIPNSIELVASSITSGSSLGSAFQNCMSIVEVNVYEVEGYNSVAAKYSSVDGVLLYDNPTTGEKEIAYFPAGRTGVYEIPEGVTVLTSGALAKTQLTEVVIPSSVKSIDSKAFYDSELLTKVSFSSAAEGEEISLTISENAFSSCKKLSDITLPSRLTELDINAFASCGALERIGVEKGDVFSEDDGVVIKLEAGVSIVFLCPKARDTEYKISTPAITVIGESAFKGCAFETFTIPEWITEIGKEAFKDCSQLKTVIFEDSNTSSLKICEKAFYSSGLTSLTLPAHLETLEAYAFGNTTKLHKVTVNCNKTTIDYAASAFVYAGSLGYCYVTELELGKDVPEIDISSVFGGKSLQTVTVHPENPNYETLDGVLFNKGKTEIKYYPFGKEGDYIIPDSVVKIGANIFEEHDNIENITIGKNISEIGERAFYKCQNLVTVKFIDAKESDADFVTLNIGKEAFASCQNFVELTLPTRLRKIGDKAFASSSVKRLETLVIPEGTESIGHSAFSNWRPENLSLPSTLKSIAMFNKDEGTANLYQPYQSTEWYYDTNTTMPATKYNIDMFTVRPTGFSDIFPSTLASISVAEGNENYCVVDGLFCVKKENKPVEVLFSPANNGGNNGVMSIPNTVSVIRDYAFVGNAKINKIAFESGNENALAIGSGVFNGMTSLNEIDLPSGMKEISAGMFLGCSELKTIVIPNTVTDVGVNAFKNCVNLSTVTFAPDGEANLTFGAGSLVEVKFSGEGYLSSRVNNTVFSGCSSLRRLELPERMTEIGQWAFGMCTSLEYIKIPATVTKIGQDAFTGCSNLTTVEFAEGSRCRDICGRAFGFINYGGGRDGSNDYRYLDKLETLTLPEGLITLGSKDASVNPTYSQIEGFVFEGCRALHTVNLPASLKTIKTNTFLCNYDYRSPTALRYINFAQNSELTTIEAYAFACAAAVKTQIESFDLSNCTQLKEIGNYAFSHNIMSSFEVPVSVAQLGQYVFYRCDNLREVTFAKDGNGKSGITNIGAYCFSESGLEEFVFPVTSGSSLTLGNAIFDKCKYLETLTLSDSVGNIDGVLAGCYCVRYLVIPDSNTSIKADDSNPIILDINGTSIKSSFGPIATDRAGTYRIPEGIIEICASAFKNQKGIKKIVLPKSLQVIQESAFENCMSLEEIGFADAAASADANLAAVCQMAFQYCLSLRSADLGGKIDSIGANAFKMCKSLASVTLREGLRYLGNDAFLLSGLTSVTLPSTLEYKSAKDANLTDKVSVFNGKEAFYCCYNLTEVTINSKWLGTDMFKQSGLTEITVPATVEKLYCGTFYGCASLQTATVLCTVAQNLNTSTAEGTYNMFRGCKSLRSVTMGANVESLGSYVFDGCVNLETVNIQGVKALNNGVFSGCTALTEVDLRNVTTYGNGSSSNGASVFSGCTNLQKVVLNDSVTYIGGSFWQNCASLRTVQCYVSSANTMLGDENAVTLPSGLKKLGGTTFSGCSAVTKITVPDSVTTVAKTDFANCTALEELYLYAKLTSDLTAGMFTASATAFMNLRKVVINDCITGFNDSIWKNCENLRTIQCYDSATGNILGAENEATLPSGLIWMNNYVLQNTAVEVINLPKTIKYVCTSNEAKSIFNKTASKANTPGVAYDSNFRNIPNLRIVKVTSEFKWLADNAFTGSPNLQQFGVFSTVDGVQSFSMSSLEHIGAGAFAGTNLQSAIGISAQASIGAGAFKGTGLTAITLPEGLTEIPASLFENCASIETLTIPSTVTSIGAGAFKGTGLTAITLPEGLTEIPASLFENCASIETLTIPSTVTSIGAGAFKGTGLTAITLPEGLTEIPASLFENAKITEITLPSGLQSIGDYAFQYCEDLTGITLPEGLTSIGFQCFYGCGLEQITLPASLTSLGGNALFGLDVSAVGGEGATYFMESGAVVDKTGKLIYLPVDASFKDVFVIPEGVTGIASYAFNARTDAIPAVKLPSTLVSLDANAFWNYRGAIDFSAVTGYTAIGEKAFRKYGGTALVLPEGITSLGANAFENCTADVDLSACKGLTTIPTSAFKTFQGATLLLPESITSLGTKAFESCAANVDLSACTGLTQIPISCFESGTMEEIKLPASINWLGNYAFRYCSALRSVSIPEGVNITNNPYSPFTDCTNLTSITIPSTWISIRGNSVSYCLFVNCALEEAVFPEGVETISYCFKNCAQLKKFVLPKTVTTVTSPFTGCKALRDVTLAEGMTTIPSFEGCEALSSISIPSTVTSLPSSAFKGTGLRTITLPEGLTAIPGSAFENCVNLETVTIPSTVTSIGTKAFIGAGLTAITLPEGLTAIPNNAFENCAALETVTIPSTVTSIGTSAFKGCARLATLPIEEINNDYLLISANAFENSGLTSVELSGKIASTVSSAGVVTYGIAASVFAGCTSLQKVIIGEGATTIGNNAFKGCSALTEITLPEGLTSINSDAFTGCSALTSVTIPTTVNSLAKAFADWTAQQEIILKVNAYDGIVFSLNFSTWCADATCKAKISVICINPVYAETNETED